MGEGSYSYIISSGAPLSFLAPSDPVATVATALATALATAVNYHSDREFVTRKTWILPSTLKKYGRYGNSQRSLGRSLGRSLRSLQGR